MQQFTVPQFIEVEDKIIGPITVRQFIIMIIGGLFMFLEYKLSDFVLFLILAIPTFVIFGTFAFLKINGMPFQYFVLNVVETLKKPKIRVWLKEIITPTVKKKNKEEHPIESLPIEKPLTKSRISDISLIVDTGGIYKGESPTASEFKK
ncbi:PrgI family protein [Patescibacteria group bacterium]|nr:PrgI family protein [Patescibacteria group bacterium]